MAGKPVLEKIIRELQAAALRIRELEAEANRSLYRFGDEKTYRLKLAEKTELLIGLPKALEYRLQELEPDLRSLLEKRLQRFFRNAAQAKRIDSVFYMSALLYPEDYKEGQRNDLENCIAFLEEKIQRDAGDTAPKL